MPMTFKEAVSEFASAARTSRGAPDLKPSPSQSNEARGIWFLRDRKGEQIARISKGGVRFAGSMKFVRKRNGRTTQRARG